MLFHVHCKNCGSHRTVRSDQGWSRVSRTLIKLDTEPPEVISYCVSCAWPDVIITTTKANEPTVDPAEELG